LAARGGGTSLAARPDGAEARWPADAIEVGRIGEPWGLKGWFKVQPYTTEPQALFSSRRWFLLPPDPPGSGRAGGLANSVPPLLLISEVKSHAEAIVALARDVQDRNAAEALRGARIFVGRSSFPTAGPDEYYWVDLIGLSVVNRQGLALGTVAGLIDTGPQSVLRVASPAPAAGAPEIERLIPFVAAYVDEVNLERRMITVDWGPDY
jgi:16S rRNA processing protein RimM